MKRETRPFTVEVRRGAKKQATTLAPTTFAPATLLPSPPASPSAGKTPMQRAEEILFSRDPAEAAKESPPRSGRILEPVIEPSVIEAPKIEAAPTARRRGRPPGSKNRPTAQTDQKAPRGRPRLGPEVRQLQLTPELVNAAIETMTKLAPGQSLSISGETRSFGRDGFEESKSAPIKRPRGRPRKTPLSPPLKSSIEVDPITVGGEAGGERPRRMATRRPASLDAAGAQGGPSRGLKRFELNRLFKPGERWKARMRLRSLARRRRA